MAHRRAGRAGCSTLLVALATISQGGFLLWVWLSVQVPTMSPTPVGDGKEEELYLWAKIHGFAGSPRGKRNGTRGGGTLASIADRISPEAIERARRARGLSRLMKPHRTNIQHTTTTAKPCVNESARNVGASCWAGIWHRAGCVGTPRYSSWHVNQTYAELRAGAESMFRAVDDDSVRECHGEDEYSRRRCATTHERNATEETDVGAVCWDHLWHTSGCTEPPPEYTQLLAQETFARLEAAARSWATLPDRRHVRGCYGEAEASRREAAFGRRACDEALARVGGQAGVGIGSDCWAHVWRTAGCTEPAPVYSAWHANQTLLALEDDARAWHRRQDAQSILFCRGQAGLEAFYDDQRTAVRFAPGGGR